MFVVLKGKKVPADLENLETERLILSSSDNAWINEDLFLKWISRVWKPYAHNIPRSLLILDQFRVHMMPSILKELEDCRTDVVFVPKGMTFFSQPCDVFLNKPLKDGVRACWRDFILDQKDVNGMFS